MLVCGKCGGRMEVIAFIQDEMVAQKILAHLGLTATTPPLCPARDPPQMELTWDLNGTLDADPGYEGADPEPDDFN